MRIKKWELIATWDDGERADLSYYVDEYTARAINDFLDYFEERYGRVPILDSVEGENAPLFCMDPPTPDENPPEKPGQEKS